MPIRLFAALLVAIASGSLPVRAEQDRPTAVLREAFAQLPDALLRQGEAEQAWFMDVSPLVSYARSEADTDAFRRMVLGGSLPPVEALRTMGPKAWTEAGAPPLADIRYVAGFGQPPVPVALWGLRDATTATAILQGLEQTDFKPIADRPGMLASGEPSAIDFKRRDPANPWRGPLGRSYFVAARGSSLFQSVGPEPVSSLLELGDAERLTGNAFVATALDGLDRSAEGGRIWQAMLVSPAIGLAGLDPAALLGAGGDMDAMRARLEAAQAQAARGIPPFFSGLVADVQRGAHPGLAISLVYPDCATAERAGTQLVGAWTRAFGRITPGTAQVAAVPGDTLCAAAVTITAEAASETRNQLFLRVYGGHISRQANIFQIGQDQD